MSKSARRRKTVRIHAGPPKEKRVAPEQREKIKRLVVFIVIGILAAIPFSIGKYFEFNSIDPFDSGGYVYSAKKVLDGARIGIDEKPSAQLGTLLVNMLGVWVFGFNETGPKLIQTLFQLTAFVLMFIAMRRLHGTLPAAVSVIVASVYLSWSFIAKTGNVKDQYMIACSIIAISCFVMHRLSGKWWQAVVAGAVVSWGPLFKQTGASAIIAIGLFVTLQPLLKNQTWKQTGKEILLLCAGAAAAIGPLYVWILVWNVQMALPYEFVWQTLVKFLPASAETEQAKVALDYVSQGRKLVPFSEQWPKVLYFYGSLIMPIALATTAIVIRIARALWALLSRKSINPASYERLFPILACWWVLDMAFVWISPRSYVQYYLPLNASAAMLGGYAVAIYWDKARTAVNKAGWLVMGMVGLLLMIGLSWHVFFGSAGRRSSADSYRYMLKTASLRRRGLAPYRGEAVGEYIRTHSEPTDKIYVWGWMPGIYVKAQRFSAASKACCLPRPSPPVLAEIVDELLTEFKRQMPKFIVDTRKRDVPVNRPPYELWPIVRYRGAEREVFLALEENAVARYEESWAEILRKDFGDDEAERFKVLAPLRKLVRENYEVAEIKQYGYTPDGRLDHAMFGEEVLFKLKDKQESQPGT